MNQIFQNLLDGTINIIECSDPMVKSNEIKIRSTLSLISLGTEKMLLKFGNSNLIGKVKQQPEKVAQVLNKIKTDGIISAYESVTSRLNEPMPLGYSNVGIIEEIGSNIKDLSIGDRVVSNGPHADVVVVPRKLCSKIPIEVDDTQAVFTIVASIALQGIRLLDPKIGETVAVFGVGLIGNLTIQILLANGCKVLAFDFDSEKLSIVEGYGASVFNLSDQASDPVDFALHASNSQGVDGVLITASTNSNDPVDFGARMSKKRGKIILVGVSGLELKRELFYKKELSFQVSCSYGPGRYDTNYEILNNDYPFAHVRWTQNRNFEAILNLLSQKKIDTKNLVTSVFDFADAANAYESILDNPLSLGVLLSYNHSYESKNKITHHSQPKLVELNEIILSLVGAGNYASRVLMPAINKINCRKEYLVSINGANAAIQAKKNYFEYSASDINEVLESGKSNLVVIATRHDSHAELTIRSLKAGKNVFVEKPLAINTQELEDIKLIMDSFKSSEFLSAPQLMVGFNRRFSPHSIKAKEAIANDMNPKSICISVNAGFIESSHWTQDRKAGGGRIIGEVCHFIDLARFFIGKEITSWNASAMEQRSLQSNPKDTCSITLNFSDGSLATIMYFANGSPDYPKEKIDIFSSGKIVQINNFKNTSFFGYKNKKNVNSWKQNKGQMECLSAFAGSLNSAKTLIPFDELYEVSKISIEISEYLG